MGFIYDRLYGRLEFPEIVCKLIDSPELLRLREIGLGNIRFFSFPSFSAVTRFEHSLGVCHLAKLASESLKLTEKDKIELMVAGLYHDVTTPPFAHATEQILKKYFGFDHEKHLRSLLLGESEDLGKYYSQIYFGKEFRLRSICQGADAREIGIDLFQILSILSDRDEPLSSMIKGEIDLDNIDNVIRASSAMGIDEARGQLSETLARSFVFHAKKEIAISAESRNCIESWKRFRETLYDLILCSIEDFALQTMLKHALVCLAESADESTRLNDADWKLTENQIIYEKMLKDRKTESITKRMFLNDLYTCLGLVWVSGQEAPDYIERKEPDLEKLAEECLRVPTVANYYEDKRYRAIKRPLVFFGSRHEAQVATFKEPALLVGFFTPSKTVFDKEWGENPISLKRREEFLNRLRDTLPKHLSLRHVSVVQRKYPHLEVKEEIA